LIIQVTRWVSGLGIRRRIGGRIGAPTGTISIAWSVPALVIVVATCRSSGQRHQCEQWKFRSHEFLLTR
jgi:hypothetical protein